MASRRLPRPTHSGTVAILDVLVPCHNLPSGHRILEVRPFLQALGILAEQGDPESCLVQFLELPSVAPFVSDELAFAVSNPIKFRHTIGCVGLGYDARILAEVCSVGEDAYFAGGLGAEQMLVAHRWRNILAAIRWVGTRALRDEASGRQETRGADSLQTEFAQSLAEPVIGSADKAAN